MFFGSQIFRLDQVDSTNNFAANLIEQALCQNGTLVLADTQTDGKGQRGSLWESESGKNMLCSYIFFPDKVSVDCLEEYSWSISLALLHCLNYFGIESKIKWPNDILVKNLKIAGILIENNIIEGKVKSMIIGIGLNVNQLDFSNVNAISMSQIKCKSFVIDEVSIILTRELNYWTSFVGKNNALIKKDYLQQLFGFQTLMRFEALGQEFEGTIIGVNHRGELEMYVQDEIKTFRNKEISFLL